MNHSEKALVIFPHQLFKDHPGLDKDIPIYIVEDQLFFYDYHYQIPFHKQKLILHRASMKAYDGFLIEGDYQTQYINYAIDLKMDYLFQTLVDDEITEIICCDPVDWALEKRLKEFSRQNHIKINILDTPAFLNNRDMIISVLKKQKNYRLTSFYMNERKRMNILMDGKKPIGKRWTFDKFNRKKMPQNTEIPPLYNLKDNKFVKEARKLVAKEFPNHPGSDQDFIYPITHHDAELWLQHFLKHKLLNFGNYEDYIDKTEPFLFHSLISSSLNLGLLIPQYVVDQVLKVENIPLNSLEGFLRQIIGWREFLRGIYVLEGSNQRKKNFLNHKKAMPTSFWEGTTGLLPYDSTVQRVMKNAYAHHIERLMILGNLMLLGEIHPDTVYQWFMTLFIDAYDWVMVPNVYGMSQYADGGLITTKPYISSSNYLRKMSNYPSGDWNEIWDALFWNFMWQNRALMENNPRLAILKGQLNDKKKIEKHRIIAKKFFEDLK